MDHELYAVKKIESKDVEGLLCIQNHRNQRTAVSLTLRSQPMLSRIEPARSVWTVVSIALAESLKNAMHRAQRNEESGTSICKD